MSRKLPGKVFVVISRYAELVGDDYSRWRKACGPDLDTKIDQWIVDNIPFCTATTDLKESFMSSIISNLISPQPPKDWPWFRAGAVVVNNEGKILMIHEGRVQVKKIKDQALQDMYLTNGCKPSTWTNGDGGWNLPAGRLHPGETFEDGAEREVNEESGWDVVIKQPLCIRTSEKPDNQYYMPVFLAEAVSGPAEFHTVKTRETLEIGWFTVAEIRQMCADDMLRSPEFVTAAIDAYGAIT